MREKVNVKGKSGEHDKGFAFFDDEEEAEIRKSIRLQLAHERLPLSVEVTGSLLWEFMVKCDWIHIEND